MFHFFKSKNDKTEAFDEALNKCIKIYEKFIEAPSLRDIITNFKLDIDRTDITCFYQRYMDKANTWLQELHNLQSDVSKLEPQTEDQVIQKQRLQIKLDDQTIRLLDFTNWAIRVKIAYNQGYADGSHKAEEKPMD